MNVASHMRRRLSRRRRGVRKLGVVLAYNDVDMILDTVGHLLTNDHEVIVWDNGSTDGTFERLSELRRDLSELRSVPRDEIGLYEIYGAMSRHLMSGVADDYDWVSWPDSDEILLSDDTGETYAEFVDRVTRSPYDWVQFRNWNFWWTSDDDASVASPVARIRRYASFDTCAPRIRAWRSTCTNEREFNHNPLPGERYPRLANLCHYPMRSAEQAAARLRTRGDIQRDDRNWHYNRLQRSPELVTLAPELLHRADQDPRERGLRLVEGGFDWFSVYGR